MHERVSKSRHAEWDGHAFHIGDACETGQPIYLSDADMLRHVCVTGSTSNMMWSAACHLLRQQVKRGGGAVVVRLPGSESQLDDVYAMCVEAGRTTDFLPVYMDHPEVSKSYNLVADGDADDVARRLSRLIKTSDDESEAYRKVAVAAISVVVGAMKRLGVPYGIKDILSALISAEALQSLLAQVHHAYPESAECYALISFVKQFARSNSAFDSYPVQVDDDLLKKTFGRVAVVLSRATSHVSDTVVNAKQPSVSLRSALASRKVVYISAPIMCTDATSLAIYSLVLSDLLSALEECIARVPSSGIALESICVLPALPFEDNHILCPILERARSARVSIVLDSDRAAPDVVMGRCGLEERWPQFRIMAGDKNEPYEQPGSGSRGYLQMKQGSEIAIRLPCTHRRTISYVLPRMGALKAWGRQTVQSMTNTGAARHQKAVDFISFIRQTLRRFGLRFIGGDR